MVQKCLLPKIEYRDLSYHIMAKVRKHFFLINATAKVVNKLGRTISYQESQAAEEYLDEFQTKTLITYTNTCTIVVKFCYSLQTIIWNQIVILLIERPKDTDLSA